MILSVVPFETRLIPSIVLVATRLILSAVLSETRLLLSVVLDNTKRSDQTYDTRGHVAQRGYVSTFLLHNSVNGSDFVVQ